MADITKRGSDCDDGEGERGERGERGKRGKRGKRGEAGERGESGERGERGPDGHRGPTGPGGPGGPATSLVGPTSGPAAQIATEEIPAGFVIVFAGSVALAEASSLLDPGLSLGATANNAAEARTIAGGDCSGPCPASSNKCCYSVCQQNPEGFFPPIICTDWCCKVADTLGVALANVAIGEIVDYISAGPAVLDTISWDAATGGSGGLIPGQIYYLSQTEPGRLTPLYPFGGGKVVKIGQALNSTTLNVKIESGHTDGYTVVPRPPLPGAYSVVAYGFASGQDLKGSSNASWQLASINSLPGTPIYKDLVDSPDLIGQQPASASAWLSSHVIGLTTPTPPMVPIPAAPNRLESFISGGLFHMTAAQWDAVWTSADPNRGLGSGLRPGFPYYLSDVPGTFFLIDATGVPPVAPGNWITKCFVALSSTTALIQIGDPRQAAVPIPGAAAGLLKFSGNAASDGVSYPSTFLADTGMLETPGPQPPPGYPAASARTLVNLSSNVQLTVPLPPGETISFEIYVDGNPTGLVTTYSTDTMVVGSNVMIAPGLVPVGSGQRIDVRVTTSGFLASSLPVSAAIGVE